MRQRSAGSILLEPQVAAYADEMLLALYDPIYANENSVKIS
jgi:hypothetical protein